MFFNSVSRDRLYNADDFCLYFASLFDTGVLERDDGSLSVNASTGMQIIVSKGYAFIDGHMYVNTEDKIMTLNNADGLYKRIDSIVLRLSKSDRNMTIVIKKGENSGNPVVPPLIRDGDTYELQICHIKVDNGITQLMQSMIIDTRDDANVCGYVRNNADEGEKLKKQIEQIKTDNPLFASYQNALVKFWLDKSKKNKAYIAAEDIKTDADKTLNTIIENDLVKFNDRTVDLSAGTDLSNFMTTAKDFTNYRKPINTNILNGIPNSDASMCFYIKMRTTVLGYRSSDKTTWIAGYTNGTLSKFETFITHEQITASTTISEQGKYIADAYAIKALTDGLKKCNEDMVTKKFSGSKDFAALTNIEQWARTTEHYTFYRKANNIKVTNGIPDSDGATCFYVRMGSYVLCNRASDNSFWFAGFYNDVLTGWTELTSGTVKKELLDACVKYESNPGQELAAGIKLATFIQTAKNYTVFHKAKGITISDDLPNSTGNNCYFIKFGVFVLGYSTNGHTYVAQALNNTLTPWAELPDGNNEMSQIALDKSGDGQLYMLKVLRNGSQVMILMTESDGTVRFAMFNGTQYVSSPLILHRDGTVEVGGTLKPSKLETNNGDIKNANVDVLNTRSALFKGTGDGQVALQNLYRNDKIQMIAFSEADGSIRFAMYDGTNYVSTPIRMYRDGHVDIGNINTDNGSIDTLTVKLLNGNNPNTYFAKASQLDSFSKVKYTKITTNPANKNYIGLSRAANTFFVPLFVSGANDTIEKVQTTDTVVRVFLGATVNANVTLHYLIVYL